MGAYRRTEYKKAIEEMLAFTFASFRRIVVASPRVCLKDERPTRKKGV